jgi:mono/diheme cytochrome c family protein
MRIDAGHRWAAALALVGTLASCRAGERAAAAPERPAYDPGPVPPEHAAGAKLFLAACTGCHGRAGSGFVGGPPLLDTLYLAPAFPDSAIRRAVLAGVPRRHWGFDDMPAVRTVRPHEIPAVVGYLRWAQRRWVRSRDSAGRAPAPALTPGGGGD